MKNTQHTAKILAKVIANDSSAINTKKSVIPAFSWQESRFLFLLTIVIFFTFGTFSTSFAYKQVITAAEMERAGVGRLNDILRLTDEWSITTIDGYTWWASPGGLESYQGQNFKVMIDGQLIPLEIFDTQHLERLPISISQLDSVVFISSPGLHYGVSTDRGLIHFFTRKPGEGLSIRGTQFGGNESGEPGPWKFVPEFYSENVDRIGPDYSGIVSFETPGGFWTSLTARGQFQFNADSLMLTRLNNIYPYATPRNSHLAYSATGGFKLLNKEFRYLAGNSTIEEYYFFFIPISNEIPVTGVLNHAGLSSVPLGKNGEFNYSLSYSQQDFQKYKNAQDWNLDYTATTISGNVDRTGISNFKEVDYQYGFRFKLFEQDSEVNFLAPFTWEFYDVYGSFAKQISDKYYLKLTFDVTIMDHDYAPKITQLIRYQPAKKLTFDFLAAHSQRFVEEDNPTWNLLNDGFIFDADNHNRELYSYHIYDFTNPNKSETTRFELLTKYKYSDTFNFYFGGYYNVETVRNIAKHSFRIDEDNPGIIHMGSFNNYVVLISEGNQVGFKMGFCKKWTEKCTHRFSYRFFNSTEQTKWNRLLWDTVPHYRASYHFDYQMEKTFTLHVQGTYYNETIWGDYSTVYRSSQPNNDANRTDDLMFVDVSATKTLFNGKLWLNFRFRNIFEDELIWHPIGGVNHDLTYNIQARLLLDQIWNPWK